MRLAFIVLRSSYCVGRIARAGVELELKVELGLELKVELGLELGLVLVFGFEPELGLGMDFWPTP